MSTLMVLTLAHAHKDITEQGGDNRGQMVKRFLAITGLPEGNPWCAAFVAYCGFHGCWDIHREKSYWPLPKTASCYELGEFARKKGILMDKPEVSDVFLVYFDSKKRFAHTGFILSVNPDGSCTTIEGNTSGGGSREGWGVFVRTRRFAAADRFVRWKQLLPEMK